MMLRTTPWVALLSGTPINCLLVDSYTAEFVSRASAQGIATLAVLKPGPDPAHPARQAIRAGLQGIVLEGDFPAGTAARVRDLLADAHAVIGQSAAPTGSCTAPLLLPTLDGF